jgi:glyoxylase-like metal-dependent hydrolase (beta-lactamase superfamily II)
VSATAGWPRIGLEDDPADLLRKASRGASLGTAELAHRTGIEERALAAWLKGDGVPTEDQARALAVVVRLDPGKFADACARRWYPGAEVPPDVRHHPHDPHPSNGYIFFLQDGKTAALVDPAGYPPTLLRAVNEGPYALRYILITHKHADHCDATADVSRAFPDADIVMHKADVKAIGSLAQRAIPIADGEELPFGDGASIRMLHTPGHTDGSSCFLFRSTVFSGDTLFAGSVGGIFADDSTYDDLLESVRFKLFALDDDTVVMPGHGPPTTIAEEKAHNPFF